MKSVCFILIFFGLFLSCQNLFAQNVYLDVITLKNGSVVKGVIEDTQYLDSMNVRLPDGTVLMFKKDEVSKLSKETHNPLDSGFFDVVVLKNGSILKGTIVEVENPENIGVKISGGNVLECKKLEVIKITKEEVAPVLKEKTLYGQSDEIYAQYGKTSRGYKQKYPALSLLLSLILPGGGQYYNGQYVKGGVMTGIAAISSLMIIAGNANAVPVKNNYSNVYDESYAIATAGSVILFVTSLWSLIDAPVISCQINRLANIRLGKYTSLNIRPDFSFNNNSMIGSVNHTPALGVKFRLEL